MTLAEQVEGLYQNLCKHRQLRELSPTTLAEGRKSRKDLSELEETIFRDHKRLNNILRPKQSEEPLPPPETQETIDGIEQSTQGTNAETDEGTFPTSPELGGE